MALRRIEPVMGTVVSFDIRDDVVPTARSTAPSPGSTRSTSGSARSGRTARSAGWLTARWPSPTRTRTSARSSRCATRCARLGWGVRRSRLDGRRPIRSKRAREGLGRPAGRGSTRHRRPARLRDQCRRRHRRPRLTDPGASWRVGIRHPDRPDRVAGVISISDAAVATSGDYERGEHIRDPRSPARRAPGCAA